MQEAFYRRTRLPGQHLVGDMIPMVRVYECSRFTVFSSTPRQAENSHPPSSLVPITLSVSAAVCCRRRNVKIEKPGFTEAPIGQATGRPNLVDSNMPGGGGVRRAGRRRFGSPPFGDSTAAAYAKIASVVVASAVVTWFGVPLLWTVSDRVVHWFASEA